MNVLTLFYVFLTLAALGFLILIAFVTWILWKLGGVLELNQLP